MGGKFLFCSGAKKKGGKDDGKKEEPKKEEIKYDPITPESLMVEKPFGKANKKFAKVSYFWVKYD